jgi:hypothetical protein
MTYLNLNAVEVVETKRSIWRRMHWERIALLAVNFGIWAMIIGMFT